MLAKTYRVIPAILRSYLKQNTSLRVKAITKFTLGQIRLSGPDRKPSVKSRQEAPQYELTLLGSPEASYAKPVLQPVLKTAP